MQTLVHIGFPGEEGLPFLDFLKRKASQITTLETPLGDYLVFSEKSGAQIYFQRSPQGLFLGLNVHFEGKTEIPVLLVRKIERNESPLDGALLAWVEPVPEITPKSGSIPFVFDLPDFYFNEPHPPYPFNARLQLTAFPVRPTEVYDSEEHFQSLIPGTSKLNTAFVASGLFMKSNQFESNALITAKIVEKQTCINPDTGISFYHLIVESSIGAIDLVTSASFVPKEPPIAGIISGEFSLSGKLLKLN